ncbi:MAG: hypothetical protein P8130_02255 [Deltaproteobacteria bacterium]
MGNIELSLMKKTILVLRDWDAFQATCRQCLKMARLASAARVKKGSAGELQERRIAGNN